MILTRTTTKSVMPALLKHCQRFITAAVVLTLTITSYTDDLTSESKYDQIILAGDLKKQIHDDFTAFFA